MHMFGSRCTDGEDGVALADANGLACVLLVACDRVITTRGERVTSGRENGSNGRLRLSGAIAESN